MSILRLKQQILRLLKWLQKFTKTDMVYLAHGSFWMMLRQVVTSLIAFGMAIAFANLLPKEIYGAYKYVLSTSVLIAITTLSGINTSLTRSVAKGFEGSLIPALYTRMKWGVLGSLVALGFVLYYHVEGNTSLTTVFILVMLFLPFKSSFSVYHAFWQGKQQFDVFSKFAVLQDVLATLPMLTVLFFTDSLFLIVLTYFCAQSAASAIFYFLTQHRLTHHTCDPEMVPYGKHLSFSGVLFTIANNCTDVILWQLLGPVPVAVYAFATRPPQELRRVFTEAFPIALPKFAQRSKEEIQHSLPKKIAKLYVILIPCVILYILVAPVVYQVFFPAYLEAVRYSQIFSLTILFAPLSLFGTVFQALGRTREIYVMSVLSPILLIASLFIFVPLYGLMGAVIALLSELALQSIVVLILFKRM